MCFLHSITILYLYNIVARSGLWRGRPQCCAPQRLLSGQDTWLTCPQGLLPLLDTHFGILLKMLMFRLRFLEAYIEFVKCFNEQDFQFFFPILPEINDNRANCYIFVKKLRLEDVREPVTF